MTIAVPMTITWRGTLAGIVLSPRVPRVLHGYGYDRQNRTHRLGR